MNKTGPTTDLWGTLIATGLQLDLADNHNPQSFAIHPVLNPPQAWSIMLAWVRSGIVFKCSYKAREAGKKIIVVCFEVSRERHS